MIVITPLLCDASLAPIASPVRFARVQWKSFCAGVRYKRLERIAGKSQKKETQVNADGSVDLYLGPKSPAGKESNWVQTLPDKGWSIILRLYGPQQSWFDKTWKPSEIEEMK